MNKVEVFVNWNGTVNSLVPQFMNFSAGEVHLASPISVKRKENVTEVFIVSNIQSSEDILRTLTVTNAIRNTGISNISLVVPYLPYSRSDRVCSLGEEFGLEVFSSIINSQNYNKVFTFDAHSNVAEEVIPNLVNIKSDTIITHTLSAESYDYIVSPDKGAKHKSEKLSLLWGIPYVEGFKIRDPATGNLSGFGVNGGEVLQGKRVLVPDDIADGSGTFVGLLKEIKKYHPLSVDLFVTHGIFSKGVDVVAEFDKVITLNSFNPANLHLEDSNSKNTLIDKIVNGDFYYE